MRRRAGGGTDHLQAESDGEILFIGRGGDHDGIARRCQRDGVPDGFTRALRRLAIIVVAAVHPFDVPDVGGEGRACESDQHERDRLEGLDLETRHS